METKYDEPRNQYQNIQLHRLIDRLKIDNDLKEDLVRQFTGGRESSSKMMTWRECESLLDYLRKTEKQMKPGETPICIVSDRMRKKILSICHEMNWRKDSKIDWDHLNSWLKKYGYLHKSLNAYKKEELPKLVTQFENLLTDYYAKR